MLVKVIDWFENMSVEPDWMIIAMLFEACGKLHDERAIRVGKEVLRRLPQSLMRHEAVTKAAVGMLMKFGEVPEG